MSTDPLLGVSIFRPLVFIRSPLLPDDSTFIRPRYSWRSTVLNNFVDKLEQRVAKSKKKTLARKRVYGTQLDRNPPANALEWMKVDASPPFSVPEESGSHSSNELFCSEDDTDSNVANN